MIGLAAPLSHDGPLTSPLAVFAWLWLIAGADLL